MSTECINPTYKEELRQYGNTVDGVALGQRQVLFGIAHGGIEMQGALIVEYGKPHLVGAVIAVSEVVVEVGRSVVGTKHKPIVAGCKIVIAQTIVFVAIGTPRLYGCFAG